MTPENHGRTAKRHALFLTANFIEGAGIMRKFVAAIAFIFIALILIAPLAPAQADNFPSRPITLIVPFPPGGSTDVAARIMADKMGAALGQPVIVENVGGAGGSIGVGRLARSTPDGYTIDIGQWDTHVGSIIYNINFDLRADFAPIGLISINPMLLVAKKTLPADDLKSLVAYMKAHPGDAKFVNQNASAQVGGLLLQKLTGTELLFVRYRGAGPAMRTMTANAVHHLSALVAIAQIKEHAFGLPTWRQSPIDDVNFANLKADIEKNGILEPILIFEGRSYRAAKAVGRLTATKRELTSPLEPAQQSELKPPAAKLIKRLLKPPPQAQQEAKTIEGPQINAALQVSEEHEAKAEPLVPLGFTQSPTIAAAAYEGALCLDPATPFDNAQKLVSSRAWHPVECTRT